MYIIMSVCKYVGWLVVLTQFTLITSPYLPSLKTIRAK